MTVLIIGMGNIGKKLVELGNFEKIYAYDRISKDIPGVVRLGEFQVPSDVSTVVECASPEAVKEYSLQILKSPVNYIIISTSAFADEVFRERFFSELKNSPARVFFPSGAIGGLDVLSSIKDFVETVRIETIKPPKSLGLDLKGKTVVFEGSVEEASKLFPRNINVASTIGLIVGFEKVKVTIVADPAMDHNIHIVRISSAIGNYEFKIENIPSPENPKTSMLTVYSILRALRNLESKIVFG
ncbi:MAG TPA: aspartate dehydrogenase [Thermotoga sp.]|uniref:L-aspartate dehydrogenase n=2 Tax=Thermotoga TaxID=2335 RepID=ASPD_THESQ|nr:MULTISPECIES: aspartate dehydrogenase [Thermotoga]B1LB32.1 RecName: Full=L-aspartate dehydrogenase [Thermotoga sp. RQ2]ACB09530.1 Aspartate dehydrogenase [Thermotoga sp. RQ2]ADA67249.1 Aspartate dehydrogenase [Thermotoga petrophila RKU-10]HBF69764.1 aspartate dehydrogenase [Thermotoga sp.]